MFNARALLIAIGLSLGIVAPAFAIDPCSALTDNIRQSVPISSAGQLVTASGSTSIYVCGAVVGEASGQFVYGTGSTCGTGTTNVTGDMGFVDEEVNLGGFNSTLFVVPSGQNLCITSGGAIAGVLSYVQK